MTHNTKFGLVLSFLDLVLIVISQTSSSWTQQQITASDFTSNFDFGYSVSIYEDYIIVGSYRAYSNQGRIYTFYNYGYAWIQQQEFNASDASTNGYFGCSVSLYENSLIVGAYGAGKAYIFYNIGNYWFEQQELSASDASTTSYFGVSVSIYGNYSIVGASHAESKQGRAYIFYNNGNSWIQEQELNASDASTNSYFGVSVSIYGNYALVGSNYANLDQGRAYIFYNNGNSWTQEQELNASDASSSGIGLFGSSVSIYENYAIVGAYYAYSEQGSAYIFYNNGNSWIQEQELNASDASTDDQFGYSVSIYGNYVIIGAWNSNQGKGSVYIFYNNGSLWIQQQELTIVGGGSTDDGFGYSVSIYENYAIVGAPGTSSSQGNGYVFYYNGTFTQLTTVEFTTENVQVITEEGNAQVTTEQTEITTEGGNVQVTTEQTDITTEEKGNVQVTTEENKPGTTDEADVASKANSNCVRIENLGSCLCLLITLFI